MSEYNASTEFLQQLAEAAKLEVTNTRSSILGLVEPTGKQATLKEPALSHAVARPTLAPPPRLSDVLSFSDQTDAWQTQLDNQAAEWMDRYFPAMDACLRTLPEDFLCGVIGGTRPFGLDATVFELVWHRARDRAYRTLASEQRQIEAAFSGRGFTLPPGAMAAQLAAAGERAGDAIAEVNREQAIKDAEIKLELLRFAEEQALNYKRGILAALADFMRQWMALPDRDIERDRLRVQATSSLYAALSSYYNVEVAFEELALKAKTASADTDLAVDRNRIANLPDRDEANKASALAQAANAFATIAAQSAASAGTLVAQVESL